MALSLALELADRMVQSIPARLAITTELRGPVQFFEPTAGFAPIGYMQHSIYSATCSTRVVLPRTGIASQPLVIHDVRMTEIVLDLIRASYQESETAEAASVYLTLSRLILEQTLAFPPSILHAGLLMDRIEVEAAQEVAIRRGSLKFDNIPEDAHNLHLEQITQFCLVHEVTHYCIFADEDFRQRWLEYSRDLIIATYNTLLISFDDEYVKRLFRTRIDQINQCTSITLNRFPEIEELICDLSAICSLLRALELKGRLATGSDNLLLSVSATIAGTWLVAAAGSVVRDLMTTGMADMRKAHDILITRGSFAAIALSLMIGSKQGLSVENARSLSVERWRKQPDFEAMILATLNTYFSSDQLEKVLAAGRTAVDIGLISDQSIKGCIGRHFGWR